jgi:hypothetical protein
MEKKFSVEDKMKRVYQILKEVKWQYKLKIKKCQISTYFLPNLKFNLEEKANITIGKMGIYRRISCLLYLIYQ